MIPIADIQLLFDYYYWATTQLLNAARKVSNEQFVRVRVHDHSSLRATLVHTLSSERNWHARWQGNDAPANLDEQAFPDMDALQTYWRQQESAMRTYLRSIQEQDLMRVITGTTDEGNK